MSESKYKIFVKRFLCIFLAVIIMISAMNYVVDPYFCYRMTETSSKFFSYSQSNAPIWKYGRSKQYKGYDAIWVGSSLSNHVNYEYLDEKMGVKCASGVISSGRPNIYRRFIENVQKNNKLRYVFYELSVSHWCFESIVTEYNIDRYVAQYVQTDSIIDDANYLINRQVTKESLYIISGLLQEKYAEFRKRFNKNDYKVTYDKDDIMPVNTVYSTRSMANRVTSNTYTLGFNHNVCDRYIEAGLENIDKYIDPLIKENPDIQFVFVIPPSGALSFSCFKEAGCLEDYLHLRKVIFSKLLSYPNVKIIASDLDFEYNANTDHYMDTGHYDPSGATMMIGFVADNVNEITLDNLDERIEEYRNIAENFEWPFLKINFTGDRVSDLQTKLASLGYDIEATGSFDQHTEEAVKLFQQNNGIEPTGIAFSDTLNLINELSVSVN